MRGRRGSSVLVYSGPGATPRCVAATLAAIASHVAPGIDVREISCAEMQDEGGAWAQEALALVMPGGRDLPYCEQLHGDPCARVRAYVADGGAYIGLCAGAYFASRRVSFERGSALEVSGERELGFFPGVAAGSAYGGFVYGSDEGARAARVRFVDEARVAARARAAQADACEGAEGEAQRDDGADGADGLRATRCYFHGGPCLELDADAAAGGADGAAHARVEPLAWYDDEAPAYAGGCGARGALAAAARSVGAGRAVLCGAHPEMGADALLGGGEGEGARAPRPGGPPPLRALLLAHEPSRAALLRTLLRAARVPLAPLTVLSYGALLSEPSARLTFPSLRGFRLVVVRGWRRVFAHPHSGLVRLGLAPAVTDPSAAAEGGAHAPPLDLASLSAERCEGASMVCAAFDVGMSAAESADFEAREREYVLTRVPFEPLREPAAAGGGSAERSGGGGGGGGGGGWGTMCIAADDETVSAALGAEAYAQLAQSVGGTVWGWARSSRLRPAPLYLRHCLLAARALGPDIERDFLENTFLVDRTRTLGEYLRSAEGAAALEAAERQWRALPADDDSGRRLRVRFGG